MLTDIQLFNHAQRKALKESAKASPRRRANHNVHKSYEDLVQRLFIAMEPDSYVRPHRHTQQHKWEFFYGCGREYRFVVFLTTMLC